VDGVVPCADEIFALMRDFGYIEHVQTHVVPPNDPMARLGTKVTFRNYGQYHLAREHYRKNAAGVPWYAFFS